MAALLGGAAARPVRAQGRAPARVQAPGLAPLDHGPPADRNGAALRPGRIAPQDRFPKTAPPEAASARDVLHPPPAGLLVQGIPVAAQDSLADVPVAHPVPVARDVRIPRAQRPAPVVPGGPEAPRTVRPFRAAGPGLPAPGLPEVPSGAVRATGRPGPMVLLLLSGAHAPAFRHVQPGRQDRLAPDLRARGPRPARAARPGALLQGSPRHIAGAESAWAE